MAPRLAAMPDPDVERFVLTALPPPPARVLEVGAGDGELAAVMASAGYEVVAIDPCSEGPPVLPLALADIREPAASIDAAVAVVSLHHVEPLADSLAVLAEVLKPGGVLVVDEFDVGRLDEAAVAWRMAHAEEDSAEHGTPAEILAEMQSHLHSLGALRSALAEWFELSDTKRGPYLYRWHLPLGLRSAEEEEIAARRLPATGARLTGVRR